MTNKARILKELQAIPGVGPRIACDLWDLGVRRISDLQGKDPEKLYLRLEELAGTHVDRCMLYVLRCAVHFASHPGADPALLKWWAWKDKA